MQRTDGHDISKKPVQLMNVHRLQCLDNAADKSQTLQLKDPGAYKRFIIRTHNRTFRKPFVSQLSPIQSVGSLAEKEASGSQVGSKESITNTGYKVQPAGDYRRLQRLSQRTFTGQLSSSVGSSGNKVGSGSRHSVPPTAVNTEISTQTTVYPPMVNQSHICRNLPKAESELDQGGNKNNVIKNLKKLRQTCQAESVTNNNTASSSNRHDSTGAQPPLKKLHCFECCHCKKSIDPAEVICRDCYDTHRSKEPKYKCQTCGGYHRAKPVFFMPKPELTKIKHIHGPAEDVRAIHVTTVYHGKVERDIGDCKASKTPSDATGNQPTTGCMCHLSSNFGQRQADLKAAAATALNRYTPAVIEPNRRSDSHSPSKGPATEQTASQNEQYSKKPFDPKALAPSKGHHYQIQRRVVPQQYTVNERPVPFVPKCSTDIKAAIIPVQNRKASPTEPSKCVTATKPPQGRPITKADDASHRNDNKTLVRKHAEMSITSTSTTSDSSDDPKVRRTETRSSSKNRSFELIVILPKRTENVAKGQYLKQLKPRYLEASSSSSSDSSLNEAKTKRLQNYKEYVKKYEQQMNKNADDSTARELKAPSTLATATFIKPPTALLFSQECVNAAPQKDSTLMTEPHSKTPTLNSGEQRKKPETVSVAPPCATTTKQFSNYRIDLDEKPCCSRYIVNASTPPQNNRKDKETPLDTGAQGGVDATPAPTLQCKGDVDVKVNVSQSIEAESAATKRQQTIANLKKFSALMSTRIPFDTIKQKCINVVDQSVKLDKGFAVGGGAAGKTGNSGHVTGAVRVKRVYVDAIGNRREVFFNVLPDDQDFDV